MNVEYEKQIGERVRYFREKSSMTQEQLAAKLQICGCDITRSALAKLEVGQRHFYPDELLALKELLNITFDNLFYPNK